MSNKARVNLYLDRDVTERAKAALSKLDASLSEFVESLLVANLDMLEAAASGEDARASEQALLAAVGPSLLKEMMRLSDSLRTIEEKSKQGEGVV